MAAALNLKLPTLKEFTMANGDPWVGGKAAPNGISLCITARVSDNVHKARAFPHLLYGPDQLEIIEKIILFDFYFIFILFSRWTRDGTPGIRRQSVPYV